MPEPDILGMMVSAATGAKLIGISEARFRVLEKDGLFKRVDGKFRVGEIMPAYAARMKSEALRRRSAATTNRVTEARARDFEVRTAERLGKLVDRSEFEQMIDDLCALFRTALSGLPARFTRDLGERRRLEGQINELLRQLADRANEIADRLEARRPSADAVAPIHA